MQPAPSKVTRDLLALAARLGGMGVVNRIHWCKQQQVTSARTCKPLKERIIKQDGDVSKASEEQ